jgi:hypothetical protein
MPNSIEIIIGVLMAIEGYFKNGAKETALS